MTNIDLPTEFQTEPKTDTERLTRMENIRKALETGVISTAQQVEAALEPFGSHVGPMGCTSAELEESKAALDRVREAKGHEIGFV